MTIFNAIVLASLTFYLACLAWSRFQVKKLNQAIVFGNEIQWTVSLNDVEVGQLSDTQLKTMKLKAAKQHRWIIAQMFNLVVVAMEIVGRHGKEFPFTLLVVIAMSCLVEPEAVADFLATVQLTPELVEQAAIILIKGFSVYVVFALSVYALSGRFNSYGYENKYTAAWALLLRQHMGLTATGKLSLGGSYGKLSLGGSYEKVVGASQKAEPDSTDVHHEKETQD